MGGETGGGGLAWGSNAPVRDGRVGGGGPPHPPRKKKIDALGNMAAFLIVIADVDHFRSLLVNFDLVLAISPIFEHFGRFGRFKPLFAGRQRSHPPPIRFRGFPCCH